MCQLSGMRHFEGCRLGPGSRSVAALAKRFDGKAKCLAFAWRLRGDLARGGSLGGRNDMLRCAPQQQQHGKVPGHTDLVHSHSQDVQDEANSRIWTAPVAQSLKIETITVCLCHEL